MNISSISTRVQGAFHLKPAPQATPAPPCETPSPAMDSLSLSTLHPEKKVWKSFSHARLAGFVGVGLAAGTLAAPAVGIAAAAALGVAGGASLLASRELDHKGQRALQAELPEWKAQLGSPDGEGTLKKLDPKPDELEMLHGFLATPGGADHFNDLFDGAHVVIPDGGKLYKQWSQMPDIEKRVSSHKSLGSQYEISGRMTGPVLFGEQADGSGTWMQFERDPVDKSLSGVLHAGLHMEDFLDYRITGENISRYGKSHYTDRNPLVLG